MVRRRFEPGCVLHVVPSVDMSKQSSNQELVARYLQGDKWHFCHIFQGHPKRQLLQSRWSLFISLKKSVAGVKPETFILL
ncbi:auxin response factor 9-like isoform X2 [Ziziphus jujuba]|uniref:Auxin response factor 9-like isoform X2 n=1 Tax=Ziziphus jujuba TaxID=326968 RepID=A0ABM3IS05_ZIZJJ|nr:auxin response factor 9-like isoform X2 [Ziziphus jujuba]